MSDERLGYLLRCETRFLVVSGGRWIKEGGLRRWLIGVCFKEVFQLVTEVLEWSVVVYLTSLLLVFGYSYVRMERDNILIYH